MTKSKSTVDKSSAAASVSSSSAPVVQQSATLEVDPVVSKPSSNKKESSSKKAKKGSSSAGQAVVNEVVVEEVVAAAPSKVESSASVVPPLDLNAVVDTGVVAEAPSSPEPISIVQKLGEFNSQLVALASLTQSLKSQYKTLEKTVNKELKTFSKNRKNRRVNGNRPPSGFVRPTKISDEMASFLGKTAGIEMARTEVSKEIIKYIREHNLQNKTNGRQINADGKLSTLLKLSEGDVLTYFNLQRYMKHHFVKKEKAVVATV